MKKSISSLIELCSNSILTTPEKNSLRGGRMAIDTWCKTDENSDSNGDGVPDDCNEESDDCK